jgi:hypothetical protein
MESACSGKLLADADRDNKKTQVTEAEDSTLKKLLRMGHNSISAAATMATHWKTFQFDGGKVLKNIAHAAYFSMAIAEWQSISGIRRQDTNPAVMTAMNAYYNYASAVDDVFDNSPANAPRLNFMHDAEVRRLRKVLYSSISRMSNQNAIKRAMSKYDDVAISDMLKLKDEGVPNLEYALKFRYETSGDMGKMAFAMMNLAHGVSGEKASEMERNSVYVTMIAQLLDDMKDIAEDRRKNINENLMLQILRKNPEELKKVDEHLSKSKDIGLKKLAKLAPDSFKQAKELKDRMFDKIPETADYYWLKILGRMAYRT